VKRSATLIGVLDLMDGHVVRAVGGRRDEYRPVESRLCSSSTPLDVARAFRDAYGIEQLYIADLDAIQRGAVHVKQIASLADDGFRLSIDAGFRSADDLGAVSELGVECFVASVESLSHVDELEWFVRRVGAERLRFSIDLAGGVPLAEPSRWNRTAWTQAAPVELAVEAAATGITQFIVLDLHAVGTGRGPSTAGVCRAITTAVPAASIWTGGGVRAADDVRNLGDAGAEGVLVASALHDEMLPRSGRMGLYTT
jgi:phosphoribosylformimino-5-aminoimidazole carboxamide ribotide isomerase